MQSLIHFITYSSSSTLDLSHMTIASSDSSFGRDCTFAFGHFLRRWLLFFGVWLYTIRISGLGLEGSGLWSLLWCGIDGIRLGFPRFLLGSFWFFRGYYGIWGLRLLGLCLRSFRQFCWFLLYWNLENDGSEKSWGSRAKTNLFNFTCPVYLPIPQRTFRLSQLRWRRPMLPRCCCRPNRLPSLFSRHFRPLNLYQLCTFPEQLFHLVFRDCPFYLRFWRLLPLKLQRLARGCHVSLRFDVVNVVGE